MDWDSDKEGDGNNDSVMAMATKRAMVTATRMAGNKEGNGDGGKSNGNINKGGGQETEIRAMAIRVAGKRQQRGQQ